MTYPTLPANATGMDVLLTSVNNGEPAIIPLALFFIWVIITVSSYYINLRRGSGNFIASAAVSSMIITLLMSILMLAPGVITGMTAAGVFLWLVIWVGLFFATRER